ncbi:hypothetical protein K7X08_025749 [Anisodus acutangulus]|uniref:Uncharacterized protein n=1 Tax=Anisodus acutangulus TaxID=402998 RepID=A0A9Q1LB62_9SOLA|nr:hypothetical protein K7X08_025749 [Anisodus acutangulus]
MSVNKYLVEDDTTVKEGHDSGVEPLLHFDHIEAAVSNGQDVTVDDDTLGKESHDSVEIGKELPVEGHSSPVIPEDREEVIDNVINVLGEEVEVTFNALVISNSDTQLVIVVKRSSPNKVLHDLVSHNVVNLNTGKENINLEEDKEESLV